MNAIQFIKDHGVDKAGEVVEGAPNGFNGYNDVINKYTRGVWFSRDVLLSDLKFLVESVELVEHFGNDLVGAKQLLEFSKDCKTIELSGSVITIERLEQAIADYEAIHSFDIEKREFELGLAPDSDYVKINDMGDDSHIENHVSPNCKVGVK